MEIALILPLLVITFWLNIKATLFVRNDTDSLSLQKIFQILIIWLVPIIGSVIVLAIHRPNEKYPGKYPEGREPPDDHISLKHVNRGAPESVDGD